MTIDDIVNAKAGDKLLLNCEACDVEFFRTKRNLVAAQKAGRGIYCKACSHKIRAENRPQNNKAYWAEPEIKERHSRAIKSSEAYYASIKARPDNSGENNPQYGKKWSLEQRATMSAQRTGRMGAQATAWKGGNNSVTKIVKRALQARHQWFTRVLERDRRICQQCGNTAVDAHHIIPIVKLIKNALPFCPCADDNVNCAKWMLTRDEILDHELLNGVALCRPCHKLAHRNWGSKTDP